MRTCRSQGDEKTRLATQYSETVSRDTLYRYVPAKKLGLGSLENELYAGNRRRETMSESDMQAELERLRAENARDLPQSQARSIARSDPSHFVVHLHDLTLQVLPLAPTTWQPGSASSG
jgi:hypothetical protein